MDTIPTGAVRTPSVMQMEASECGAASLAIVLAYYGRFVPLAQLRRECGVSRDGSKASNIIAAARAHGLEADGFKKPLPGLQGVPFPYIVFWNFNHFLVVEGYRRGKVFLNDPASGRRKVSLREFAEAYSGVVLTMKPGPRFERAGKSWSVAAGLLQRLRGSAAPLLMCVCAALLQVVPGVVYPALLQLFIDRVLVQSFRHWAGPIILGIVLTALLRGGLTQIQSRMLRRFELRLSTTLSSRFVWHLLHLPASYYSQRFSGELSGRIQLNDSVAEVLSGRLAAAVIDALVMFLYLAVMFQLDRVLTGWGVLFALCQFLLLWRIGKERADGNRRLAHFSGKICGVGLSGLQAIRTIKASALESEFFEKWSGHFAKLMNARQQIDQLSQVFSVLPTLSSGIMTILVLAAGGSRVMDGHLSIGQLVAFQTLMASFLRPLNSLVSLGSAVQMLETDLGRLDDVLENPTIPDELTVAQAPHDWSATDQLEGRVELRNVSFGYHPLAPPLIQDLSLTIEPGQRVAVVGASGSGKSTVARLVAGLYEPVAGEILFDGHPRTSIPGEILTNSLAMVEQDIALFEGTLRDNLTLWDATIPPDDLAAACQDALVQDVIAAMPRGLDSELLEGGANLSGGERQRLELARALAINPSILILDEATSALDADIEHRIDRNLRTRGCACLIAAHRLSTVRDCQEIIVLDSGRVVERGSHEELIRAGGEYARLLASEISLEVDG